MRFNNSKNMFVVRVRNLKKLRENPVRAWQRHIAAFMAYFLIFQACLPTAVIAATMLSNDDFSQVLKSPVYKATGKLGGAMYSRPGYLQVDTQSGVTLASVYPQLSSTRESLPDTTLVIGDEFVQQRLIRAQMNLLLGRSLIDKAGLLLNANSKKSFELNQNDELFAAGIKFGLNTSKQFGTALTSQEVITNNMIWPEKRTINGREVIVPVVYLNTTTLATRPEGHYIQFGLSTAFNNLEIHKGVVISALGNENYQAVINSLNNIKNAGSINGAGNLELIAGNMLYNLSGQIKANNNLDITTKRGDVINKTLVLPYQSKDGSGTRLAAVATIDSATGNIKITSGGGITYEGAISNALNGGLAFNANGDIVLAPVGITSESTTKEGHWIINRSSFELLQSKLTANQLIALMAGGSITLTAAELHSTEGGIQLLAKHGIYIADEQGQFQSNRVDKIGRTQGTGSDFESFAIRTVLSAGKGVLLATDSGDITLKGAKITSGEGTQIKAHNGKVRLLVTKENSQHYLDTVRKGTWTIKTVHEEYLKETGIPNAIIGGLAVEALTGVDIEYAGREGATLQQQIDEYEKMPDTKWMADVYYGKTKFKDANGNLVPLDFAKVDLAYKYIREHNTNLSPAAMAIIAICVAVALGGAGAGLIGTGSSAIGGSAATASGLATLSFPAAAMQAGVLTLATSAAQNLAAGKNLEDTFKAITSDDGLKNLATSMATAGALSALDVGNLELFKDAPVGSGLDFANQAYQAVGNSVVTAGVSVTINGGNLDDYKSAFKQTLATYAVNTIGQKLTDKISNSTTLGDASKYIVHAALGCLTTGLTNKLNEQDFKDACPSGAAGAVMAQYLSKEKADKLAADTEKWAKDSATDSGAKTFVEKKAQLDNLVSQGADITKLTAALFAFALGGDVNAAASSASSVYASNRQNMLDAANLTTLYFGVVGPKGCGNLSFLECQTNLQRNTFIESLRHHGVSETVINDLVSKLDAKNAFGALGRFSNGVYNGGQTIEDIAKNHPTGGGSFEDANGVVNIDVQDRFNEMQKAFLDFTGGVAVVQKSISPEQQFALDSGFAFLRGGLIGVAFTAVINKGMETATSTETGQKVGVVTGEYADRVAAGAITYVLGGSSEQYESTKTGISSDPNDVFRDPADGVIWLGSTVIGWPGMRGKHSVADTPAQQHIGFGEKGLNGKKERDLANALSKNPDLFRISGKLKAAGLDVLGDDLTQLEKFAKIAKSNNLGLTEDGLLDVLKAPQLKGQKWDNPTKILDAVERASSSGIGGLNIEHKKFPTPGENVDGYVLKNAKQYQAEGSGDAGLSFKKNGVSFDDIAADGKLIDRKYGHGKAVFDEDGGVINEARAASIIKQAERQLEAVGGDASKIRWEISTKEGADGISQLFKDRQLPLIEVKYVAQNEIK